MAKGQEKAMVVIQYKQKDKDHHPIEMADLSQSFEENQVEHQSTVMIVEFRNMKDLDSEMEEGGEDEQEEPEEEVEEPKEEDEQADSK